MKRLLTLATLVALTMGLFAQNNITVEQIKTFNKNLKEQLHLLQQRRALPSNTPNSRSGGFDYDTVLYAPTLNFGDNQILNELGITIENPTDTSITFTFADEPQTDSEYIANILAAVSNPYDSVQAAFEIDSAVTHELKTRRHYVNNQLIFNGSWNDTTLFKREHSFIARRMSTGSTQCGNSNIHASLMDMKTGYYDKDDFLMIGLPEHSTGAIIVDEDTVYADHDVGTVGYMFRDSITGHRYSYRELREDPSRINQRYLHDGIDENPENTLEAYQQVLTDTPYFVGPLPFTETEQIDAAVILPPHSKTVISIPIKCIFLNYSIPANQVMVERVIGLLDTIGEMYENEGDSCLPCLDSVTSLFSAAYPTCDINILEILFGDSSQFFMYDSADMGKTFDEVFLLDVPRGIIPAISLSFTTADTLVIGRDIKAPFWVFKADNYLRLDTNTITSLPFQPELFSSGDVAPNATAADAHYLQNGWLAPGSHHLELGYNWHILTLFKDWYIGKGHGLQFSQTEVWCNDRSVGLPTLTQTDDMGRLLYVQYYNTLGQTVDKNTRGQVVIHVSVYERGRKVARFYRE